MKNILLVSILTIVSTQYLLSAYIEPPGVPKRPTFSELKNSLANPIQPKSENHIIDKKVNLIKKLAKIGGK